MTTINKISEACLCNFSNTLALTQHWISLSGDCNRGNRPQPLHRRRITSVEAS